jgi:hypothetical protein
MDFVEVSAYKHFFRRVLQLGLVGKPSFVPRARGGFSLGSKYECEGGLFKSSS